MPRAACAILLLLTLAACQRPPMVMPTMFLAGEVDPLADTPEAWRHNPHALFYATDRQFNLDAGKQGSYNHRRNNALELGQLDIDLGNKDAWDQFHAATLAKPNGKQPRPTLAAIHRQGTLRWAPAGQPEPDASEPDHGDATFFQNLEAAVQQSHGKAITVYIHGFKNSFKEAALTAAELSLYSGGLGPFILYSWPSYNNLFEYSHDRDSVRFTTAHARRLIERLANEITQGRLSATQINIIAHSTGAEVAGSLLRELGLMSHTWSPQQREGHWRIGDILLIAPDISTDVARERILKEDLRGMYDRIVVYTSKNDAALRWASHILYRTTRIGSVQENTLTDADRDWLGQTKNVSLINVDSQPSGDLARHSHHRYSGATVTDVLLCLRSNLPPEERGLVRKPGQLLWHFANDYEQRATRAAKTIYPHAP